ncbi:MAG: DNA-directed RNA polymerase subunit D [Candidatus Marsarchaeota archaeon]|nr:DNA-directed RNA polymerase subunit D [Candidatus Marsarchaeota archaeon]
MKVSVVENSPKVLRVDISGIGYGVANAIRRAAIGRIGCFAIDNVTFYENSSALFDEYLAHRMGLVPILTPKDYDEKDEIVFSIEAEGPATVYSKEMKSSDKSVKVANGDIPIIKLAEGQRLRADGKAVMGTGSRSAKFQPGITSYKAKSPTEFEFYFESFGQMPANEIMRRALDIISAGLKDIHKELKK